MDSFTKALLTLTFSLLSLSVLANTSLLKDYQTITLVSDDGPPHMIRASNSGIDIDITKAVFAQMGLETKLQYAPLARAKIMVEQGSSQATVPTFFQQDSKSFFVSDPIINYKPTVFTLKNKQINLSSLKDIKDLKVVTFQGATGYFGEEFALMSEQNDYREMYDMSVFPKLLLSGRVDVIVLDYYIFHYFANKSIPSYDSRLVKEHSLIPAVPASVGFNQRATRDEFNSKLTAMKQSNEIQSIIDKYLQPKEKMPELHE